MFYNPKLVSYDDLPEEVAKDKLPNNGSGKEYASYLIIRDADEKIVSVRSDAMEPEDCSFCRDLNWIMGELKRAYKIGLEEGRSITYEK